MGAGGSCTWVLVIGGMSGSLSPGMIRGQAGQVNETARSAGRAGCSEEVALQTHAQATRLPERLAG
jgi:hypothetical protein